MSGVGLKITDEFLTDIVSNTGGGWKSSMYNYAY